MKNKIIIAAAALSVVSCQKIEESVNNIVTSTEEKVKQKAQEVVQETVDKTISESINNVMNAQNAEFSEVFPNADQSMVSNLKGKKISFPNGSPAYFFTYTAQKEKVIPFMEKQETINEERSDKQAKKIDGKKIIEKLDFAMKFLPENTIDSTFFDDIRNDETVEYYQLKRFPNKSTIIYSPKKNKFYQFVEIYK